MIPVNISQMNPDNREMLMVVYASRKQDEIFLVLHGVEINSTETVMKELFPAKSQSSL